MTRSTHWHIVVSMLAMLSQLTIPSLLWGLSILAYTEPRRLSESWERPISLYTLGISAVVSFFLGSLGIYGLLTRAKMGIAILLTVICCVPALFGGAVYLHALLVFLAVV